MSSPSRVPGVAALRPRDALRRREPARPRDDLRTAAGLLTSLARRRALDGLLRDAATPGVDPALLAPLGRLPIRAVDLAVDHAVRMAAHEMLSHGWRPAEVLRFVERRFTGDVGSYLQDVLGYGAQWSAGVDWLVELDDLGARAWWTSGDSHAAQWSQRHPMPRARFLAIVVDVLAVLEHLPHTLAAQPETPEAPSAVLGAVLVDSSVARKVDALLARTVGTAFLDEAIACAGKAQDLLTRHARIVTPPMMRAPVVRVPRPSRAQPHQTAPRPSRLSTPTVPRLLRAALRRPLPLSA